MMVLENFETFILVLKWMNVFVFERCVCDRQLPIAETSLTKHRLDRSQVSRKKESRFSKIIQSIFKSSLFVFEGFYYSNIWSN